jgi:polyhydroxybutyrate depolymerase
MTTDRIPVRRAGVVGTTSSSWLLGAVLALLLAACSGTSAVENGTGPGGSAPGGSLTGGGGAASPGTTAPVTRPAVPSAGCKAAPTDKVEYAKQTMSVAGMDRYYILSAPAGDSAKPMPLVVDFHGLLEGADIQSRLSNFGSYGQDHGFVTAEPNGSGTPLRWNTNPDTNANPDLQFIDAMVTEIGNTHCIDTSRVYATGLSYGAIVTSFLACNRADTFAAFAPVSGITLGGSCNQDHKTPILTFHGTADPILFFNGGVNPQILAVLGAKGGQQSTTTTAAPDINGPGYPATVAKWAAMNGCDPTPKDTDVSAKVIHRVYKCPAGVDVEFFIIKDGGHNWPGSALTGAGRIGAGGEVNQDIKATEEIWKFVSRFQLPNT